MEGRSDRRTLALVGLIAGLALVLVVLRMRGPWKAAPAPPAPETPPAEPDVPPVVLATPPAAHDERTVLTEPTKTLPAHDTLVLEVVDEGNAPIAGAEVHWRVREPRARPLREDLGAATLAHTGADGRATLAVPRRAIEALARWDGTLAEGTFESPRAGESHERHGRLVLHSDWELPVEVVDAKESPVAAVELVLDSGRDVERTTTDVHGLATFPHASFALGRSPEHRLTVRVASVLAGNPSATVERPLPRGMRLRLQLPPVGSVEARVLCADGSPAPDGTDVVLGAVRRAERFEEGRDAAKNTPGRAQTSAGRVVFEGIALGLELTLSLPEKERFVPSQSFRGPERPGERVTRTVMLPPESVALHLRAVDERGDPVAGELEVRRTLSLAQTLSSNSTSVHADGEGRFRVEIETGLVPGERRALEISARGGALHGGIELEPAAFGKAGEERTIVLHPAPLVVAGQVVDGAGKPVGGHAVILVNELEDREADARSRLGRMVIVEDGRFQLYGDTEATRVRLTLVGGEQSSVPVEVPVGTSGVVIVAAKSGGVAGRLLLDPGVPIASLRLELFPAQGPPDPQRPEVKSLDDDGAFQLVGATPCPHSFRVYAGDDVLTEIPDIEIVSGEIVRDPRLASIDLRGRLHVYTLDLVTPSAVSGLDGRLEFGALGEMERLWSAVQFRRTPVVISVPRDTVDVTVHVAGYRTERLSLTPGRTELHLRRAARVRLVLPRGVELPPPPLLLGVSLEGWAEPPTYFDEHGEALCSAFEPGEHAVRWFVERSHGGGRTQWQLTLPNEQVIEVADRDDEQRVEILVTNAELAAALAQR